MPISIDQLPPEIQKQLISDSAVVKELKALHTPGRSHYPKSYRLQRTWLECAAGIRATRGEPRMWLPTTGSDHDASARLVSRLARNEVSEVRGLALILWGNFGDHRALLGRVRDFSGKQAYEPYIVYWLASFTTNLQMLYSHLLDRKKLDWFSTDNKQFTDLLLGLTHGFFDHYTVDAKGQLIRPKSGKTIYDPEESLKSFSSDEPPILAAKGRE